MLDVLFQINQGALYILNYNSNIYDFNLVKNGFELIVGKISYMTTRDECHKLYQMISNWFIH